MAAMFEGVHLVDHPLVRHKLTLLRDQNTPTFQFRSLLEEISLLLAYEATRFMATTRREVQTPVGTCLGHSLEGKKVVLVPILRAGWTMAEAMLRILPSARVGHVGLFRDPKTLEAVEYYFRMPAEMEDRDVIVVDPMLATGHSAVAAIDRVRKLKPRSLRFVCLLAAEDGVRELRKRHPDVRVYTAAIDPRLNEKGYILPGLGDAGDRLYGTKS